MMSTDTLLIFSWIASYPDHGYRSISATPACGWAIRARVRITDRTQTNCLNQKKKKKNISKKGVFFIVMQKKAVFVPEIPHHSGVLVFDISLCRYALVALDRTGKILLH